MDTDVLIVGAGPTGLMLANQLGRRGVRALIVDRHSGPAQQSRAMVVHARSLEIYSQLGIAGRAIEQGRIGEGANLWARGRLKARIPVGEIGKGQSAFPYVLMLGQDANEHILGAHLRHWDMAVQWNTELVALEQDAVRVKATLRDADGSLRTVTAAYVAGCDGARSSVRELNAIGFPGAPYEHVFFVADTEATGPMVANEVNVFLWKEGFHLYFPMAGRDRWRVIGILPRELGGDDTLTFERLVPWLRQEGGTALEFKACDWFSTYRIHHRAATRFRNGRCFLLGDAAHVHSPMGGQGMNTGLQDAYNLAWKLALVVAGRAGERLLDSYEAERLPVAERLLATTDRAFRVVVSRGWLAGLFRTRIMGNVAAVAMTREKVRKIAFRTLSQLGIGYRKSPLSRTLARLPEGAPRAGDRFPWLHLRFRSGETREDVFGKFDDTRFNLVLIGQSAPAIEPAGLGDLLRIHEIAADGENALELARASIPAPAWYLLRPDGHVGVVGAQFDPAAFRQYTLEALK